MDYQKFISEQLQESARIKEKTIAACSKQVISAIELIVASLRNRGKLLLCGNGGSAADAQHLAAEMVIRLSHDVVRPRIACSFPGNRFINFECRWQ